MKQELAANVHAFLAAIQTCASNQIAGNTLTKIVSAEAW